MPSVQDAELARNPTGAPCQNPCLRELNDCFGTAKGATLDELVEATDWLPHTTRAALTGLRKRGFTVERVRDETKGSVYRIKSKRAAVAA